MNDRQTLTVVVAARNEEAALPLLHPRLQAVLAKLEVDASILYVDDGSDDGTWTILQALAESDPRVSLLRLSRNHGKELALTAGLDHVDADAAIILDADGQDPPELIPEFVVHWRGGHDVVYGRRTDRLGDGWVRRATAALFYRLMNRLSDVAIPEDAGDFRLLSRRVLDALRQVRERQRYMKGLYAWVGFRQCAIPYQRQPRLAGRSKFGLWKLWNFALDGVTGFSTLPLRLATYVGLLTAGLAFAYGLWVLAKTLLWGDPVPGWPSLMLVVTFLGGIQLMALGVIGEYLGRLYVEVKQRPLYLVSDWRPVRSG